MAGLLAGTSVAPRDSQLLGDFTVADPRQPDDLDRRIADAQADHARSGSLPGGNAENRGWAVGIEFVGTVLVSALLGWLIDRYAGLGTAPFAMIVLLLLGFAAGTRRAMKTSLNSTLSRATTR